MGGLHVRLKEDSSTHHLFLQWLDSSTPLPPFLRAPMQHQDVAKAGVGEDYLSEFHLNTQKYLCFFPLNCDANFPEVSHPVHGGDSIQLQGCLHWNIKVSNYLGRY